MIGETVRIVDVSNRSKFNGVIVELQRWDRASQVFETKMDETKVVIKPDMSNLCMIKPEDEKKPVIAEGVEDVPLEADGMAKIIGAQRFR